MIELKERINQFAQWHYQFELNGILTPIFQQNHINRHAQRKKYFFQALTDLLGGSLKGKRVLDLGCNAGFWSLAAIDAGCEFVLGIDGRQMHIDQANLVFEVKDVDRARYEFRLGNFYKLLKEDIGQFDIVFCLGIFYHISKPMELLELMAKVNDDLLVIDTSLVIGSSPWIALSYDNLDSPRDAIDRELVMVPTRSALTEMVRSLGYDSRILKPRFDDYTGTTDYRFGTRRAFMCSKQTSLSQLDPISEFRAPLGLVPRTRNMWRWMRGRSC